MGGTLILLASLAGPDGTEALARMVEALEHFEGRVRVRTIWWGEEEARRERVLDPDQAGILKLLRTRRSAYRVKIQKAARRPAGVAGRGPVRLSPGRGVRVVQGAPSESPRPPVVLGLIPRGRGTLPSLRLELDPDTFELKRAEAEYEHRTVISELLIKT